MSSDNEDEEEKRKIRITVKTQSRNEEFVVPELATVADIKPEIAERFQADAQQLCLIYAGRPLVDTKTLTDQNVKNGFAVHLVIRTRTEPVRGPPREAQITPETVNPLNDITSSLLNNPEYIRTLINMDPRLQAYLEQNPDIAHAINNPAIMREYLQLASNPNMMQEFLRGQDISMRNLENMPGGFAALQSLYNNISEMEAATPTQPTDTATPTATPTDQSRLNAAPLPNPWSNEINSTRPLNDANMPDPRMVAEMLANPQIQQIMRDLASDPNFLQSVIGGNPTLGDPALQEYLRGNLGSVLRNLDGPNADVPDEEAVRNYLEQMREHGAQPPDAMYADELEHLSSMGFSNREANLQALVSSFGDINAAIDLLTRSAR